LGTNSPPKKSVSKPEKIPLPGFCFWVIIIITTLCHKNNKELMETRVAAITFK
jgi:hypothetical protein